MSDPDLIERVADAIMARQACVYELNKMYAARAAVRVVLEDQKRYPMKDATQAFLEDYARERADIDLAEPGDGA